MLRRALLMLSAGLMIAGTGAASAQDFPTKPIRMVTLGIGANADFVSRLIANPLSERLGKPVVVDNRSGSGVIPAGIVSSSPPDGYTLLVIPDAFWRLPFMQEVPYDPIRDFSPITLAAVTPLLVVVHPSLPVKSLKELIAYAKAKPGALNYASGIAGSTTHLAAELFKVMAGVNIVHVGYKGGGPALNAILGAEVQTMFANATGVTPHVASGRLRALAVTSSQPSKLFPELPTVAAAGVPGYEAVATMAVFAPAKTPAALIDRLNREIVRTLNEPEVRDRFAKAGSEAIGSTPKALADAMRSDMATMGKMIKAAGIRAQ